MDTTALWPLAGVALGWFLTALATGWTSREKDRRIIGKLIAKILRVHDQIGPVMRTADQMFESSDDLEKFESHRRRLYEKHLLESPEEIQKLYSLVEELAAFNPVKSIDLRLIVDVIVKIRNSSFSGSATVPELWARLTAANEVMLEKCQFELESAAKRLALHHSAATYIKIRYRFWMSRKRRKQSQTFLSDFNVDVQSAMKSVQPDIQPDGSASGRSAG